MESSFGKFSLLEELRTQASLITQYLKNVLLSKPCFERPIFTGIRNEVLLEKLQQGYHMEKPVYATKEVYDIMIDCWAERPENRPNFTALTERLSCQLEDSLRNYYQDLDDQHEKINNLFQTSNYLSKMRPVTYSNVASRLLDQTEPR